MSTDPLFVRESGVYYYYENDAQGTPQKIIEKNGNVVWSARYDSFGNCVIDTETIVSNLRLPGQYFDVETGLYYNWNRYYDPGLGRYLRTDPLGDGINLYAYCFNDPVGLIDPMGLCAVGDRLHDLLALAGMVPALGIIPDLIDAGLYLVEGDFANAGMAGLAAIPILGQGARIGQYGRKALKYADEGTEIVQRAMTRAELDYLLDFGKIRFGKAGTKLDPHFVSDAVNSDLKRARLRLALPKTPEVRVTMEVKKGVFGPPSSVKPLKLKDGSVLPGGGSERTATGVVRARVLKVNGF